MISISKPLIHCRNEDFDLLKENLIMLRKLKGFSQEEIAEKIDISRQAYGKWESGETIPDIEKCALLAEVYGITIDSLIREYQVENTPMAPAPGGKHIFGTVAISQRGQIVIYKVDTDKETELARAFGIRSIPSILFIPMNGKPEMAQGAIPKEAIK